MNIEETNDNCPICLEYKDIFVKHPTCNIHRICNTCFQETFFDKEEIYPKEPKCYDIFREFLDENGIQESFASNNHQENTYNCYCGKANDEWPLNIKEIYSICSDYDRKWFLLHDEYERKKEENTNLKQCPICRESKLHI